MKLLWFLSLPVLLVSAANDDAALRGSEIELGAEEKASPTAPTWASDVAPIMRRKCETCHRPGQVGPFALQDYKQAKGWAEMIGHVVEEERMPPWNAPKRFNGVFENERRLSDKEKETILSWIANGMPRGNPDVEPARKEWPDVWRIGQPDVVYSMERMLLEDEQLPEKGYRVPREGVIDYQYFYTETNFAEDRWVRGMEVRPGAPDVVHHVLVVVHDPKKGKFNPRSRALLNFFALAVPGDTPSLYPEGYAKRLPAGATVIFQMHYTPNGKERFDRSSVALIFSKEEPAFEVVSDATINRRFKIPAGATNHEVRSTQFFREDTGLLALFPHMHTRGKDFQYIAHYPDGTKEELLYSDYDFNWQESYTFLDPKPIPAGTKIECIGHYDNSAANPNNPDPDSPVYWGDQTFEEMFVGYYDMVVPLD